MRIAPPWRKCTCPYCFHRFYLSEAPRRVMNGRKEPDQAVYDFLGRPSGPPLGVVEPPPPAGRLKRFLRRMAIDTRYDPERRKICPHCHLFLPVKAANGELSNPGVAIVGCRSSGKSNYFGVLVRYLEMRYARQAGFTVDSQETFHPSEFRPVTSERLYDQRYGSRLWGATPQAVDQTPSAATHPEIRVPLIYRLLFGRHHRRTLLRPLGRLATNLVIFDASGEDLEDPDNMERFCRHVASASALVFLIDPCEFPAVRGRLDQDVQDEWQANSTQRFGVMSNVIAELEKKGLLAKDETPIPAAFVLGKSDSLEGMLDDSVVRGESDHRGGFDAEECARASEVVRSFLDAHAPDFVSKVEARFGNHCFFAVSALGQRPGAGKRIAAVSPRRVGDPLLWILWKLGYLRPRVEPRSRAPGNGAPVWEA